MNSLGCTASVISGTNMASTEAGGEFVTSERWMQQLASTMNLSKQARFPYFEVLLKVELLQAAAPKFDSICLPCWRLTA